MLSSRLRLVGAAVVGIFAVGGGIATFSLLHYGPSISMNGVYGSRPIEIDENRQLQCASVLGGAPYDEPGEFDRLREQGDERDDVYLEDDPDLNDNEATARSLHVTCDRLRQQRSSHALLAGLSTVLLACIALSTLFGHLPPRRHSRP